MIHVNINLYVIRVAILKGREKDVILFALFISLSLEYSERDREKRIVQMLFICHKYERSTA